MLLRLLLSIFVFVFSLLQAQVTISGKVTAKGKALKNVSVTLKDTYDGATTDANGNYTFQTSEKDSHTLVFSNSDYADVVKEITLASQNLVVNAEMKSTFNEINAVVITAGSIEASDKNRASALLKPLDIYTTAGADAQITSALGFLPGVQKVGESEGLFVRGGTGTESKIFMDGNLINNYFTNSVPGIAGRDRFNTSLFKGNVFSSGGYSALYGQALSSVLTLESIDLPERTSADFGLSPIFATGSFQKVDSARTYSYGIQAAYSNLELMTKVFKFNTNFDNGPAGFSTNANFRIKTKKGGFIKYYGSYDSNDMSLKQESLESKYNETGVKMKGDNTFHNLSYREKLGRYTLNLGSTFTYNKNDMNLDFLNNGQRVYGIGIENHGSYFNAKAVLERKINKASIIRGGVEFQNSIEDMTYQPENAPRFKKHYQDLISSVFAETDLALDQHFSARIGVRAENSSYISKWNFSPRLAIAYRISKEWTSSLAYGIFYQNPESKYINYPAPLGFQRADHYIFQIQRSANERNFRLEAFYKDYRRLTKTYNYGDLQNQTSFNNIQSAINVDGDGFAKGFELFWRDKKSIKNVDYWISYSYLDSKRDFLNYPYSLNPNFASKHTLSFVAKRFFTSLKTQVNASYTFNSGRPYYDIISQNGQNIIRNEGTIKDFSALNLSINYLPNLGKKDAKSFPVFVLSVNNVLNTKNIYGYNFSSNGQSSALRPPVNTFVFIGVFISFGIDRTQDALNSTL